MDEVVERLARSDHAAAADELRERGLDSWLMQLTPDGPPVEWMADWGELDESVRDLYRSIARRLLSDGVQFGG